MVYVPVMDTTTHEVKTMVITKDRYDAIIEGMKNYIPAKQKRLERKKKLEKLYGTTKK